MTKYWIIADTHFNHQFLIDIWDRHKWFEFDIYKNLMKIPKEDVLIHLWDICIWNDQEMHEKYIKPLECRKILVRGNHDKKSPAWYMSNGWDFVCDSFKLNQYGYNMLFTHIPKPTNNYLNIHWHLHKNIHHAPPIGNCLLYSCEFMNYQPRTLKSMLKRKTKKDLIFDNITV